MWAEFSWFENLNQVSKLRFFWAAEFEYCVAGHLASHLWNFQVWNFSVCILKKVSSSPSSSPFTNKLQLRRHNHTINHMISFMSLFSLNRPSLCGKKLQLTRHNHTVNYYVLLCSVIIMSLCPNDFLSPRLPPPFKKLQLIRYNCIINFYIWLCIYYGWLCLYNVLLYPILCLIMPYNVFPFPFPSYYPSKKFDL